MLGDGKDFVTVSGHVIARGDFTRRRFLRKFSFCNPLKGRKSEKHINSMRPEVHYCDTVPTEDAFIFLGKCLSKL